jgi:hypothetical protein
VRALLEVEAIGEDQRLGDVLRTVAGHVLLCQPRAEQAELLAVVADGGRLLLVGAALEDEELDRGAQPCQSVRRALGALWLSSRQVLHAVSMPRLPVAEPVQSLLFP